MNCRLIQIIQFHVRAVLFNHKDGNPKPQNSIKFIFCQLMKSLYTKDHSPHLLLFCFIDYCFPNRQRDYP